MHKQEFLPEYQTNIFYKNTVLEFLIHYLNIKTEYIVPLMWNRKAEWISLCTQIKMCAVSVSKL